MNADHPIRELEELVVHLLAEKEIAIAERDAAIVYAWEMEMLIRRELCL